MNLAEFQENRKRRSEHDPRYHQLCLRCLQPEFTCYCAHVIPFDPHVEYVILIHPIEARRRVATGRMAHLTLKNSHLIEGHEFTDHPRVNQLLSDPGKQFMVLYPGPYSLNLGDLADDERRVAFNAAKKLVVFVLDGTWNTAKKTLHRSSNLNRLPRICFSPQGLSEYKIRRQPAPHCLSTIEAIHCATELLAPVSGFSVPSREHDGLLSIFRRVVAQRVELTRFARENADQSQYRSYRKGGKRKRTA